MEVTIKLPEQTTWPEGVDRQQSVHHRQQSLPSNTRLHRRQQSPVSSFREISLGRHTCVHLMVFENGRVTTGLQRSTHFQERMLRRMHTACFARLTLRRTTDRRNKRVRDTNSRMQRGIRCVYDHVDVVADGARVARAGDDGVADVARETVVGRVEQ